MQKKEELKSRAFVVLLALTASYFGIYYLLIVETKACEASSLTSTHWFFGFFDRYLGCRSVNELGDALAGAFAPIAFLWLAGAVFIQSQELRAQREELDETRNVMREQVEETRASTRLFNQQTEILKRQQQMREEEQANEEFDAMVKAFRNLVELDNGIVYRVSVTGSQAFAGQLVEALPGRTDESFFHDLRGNLQRLTFRLRDGKAEASQINLMSPNLITFSNLAQGADIIRQKAELVSEAHKVKAASFGIERIARQLGEVRAMLQTSGPSPLE